MRTDAGRAIVPYRVRYPGEEMEFLLIAIGAAVLFAAWNIDVKIDKISGKIDDLTKVAKAIQAEVETIRKIVR